MSHPTRRSFMLVAGAGSVATAAVAATAVGGVTASAAPGPPDVGELDDHDDHDDERVVAYVTDVAAGEVVLMRGDSETVVTDVALARSLSRLAR